MDAIRLSDPTLQPIRGLPPGARALVVEDRAYGRNTLRRGLQALGLEVFLSPHIERARRILARVPIDLLILNIHRPEDKQPLEWVRAVKDEFPDIALIVMADAISDQLERRCDELGAAAFLVPPVSLRTLRRCIERAFTGRRLQQKVLRLERQVATATRTAPAASAAGPEPEHQVDDLWFAIFEQLLGGFGKAPSVRVE